jgi:Flagellar capping protein
MSTVSSSTSSSTYSFLQTSSSRMSGLSSGLDVDSMVNKLMKAENVPLDQLKQKLQILTWQQSDYRTLNTTLSTFKTTAFSTKLQATFRAKTASSSAESVATATAGTSATDGTYTVTVNNLATAVSKSSTAALAASKDSSGNSLNLFSQFSEFADRGYSSTDDISVTINGTALTFNLGTDNISTVVSKINKADLGVTASYDSSLNRFFLTTTSTGSDAQIDISSDSANFFSSSTNDSILKLKLNTDETYSGQDASVDFGDATGLASSTNSITVNGITLSLKSLGTTTITVSRDIDSIVSSIQSFVTDYNTTLSALYSKVQEDRDTDYQPLTDSEKASMSDTDITSWNEKASTGLLENDSLLNSIINSYRSAASSIVNTGGDYNSLSSIGIASTSYEDQGVLTIDETALREALSQDPDSVEALFTSTSSTGTQGIAVQMYTATVNGITDLTDKAGSASSTSTDDQSNIGKIITQLNTKITALKKKLLTVENNYYSEFTNMETYISQMNTQALWLEAQFGSSSS